MGVKSHWTRARLFLPGVHRDWINGATNASPMEVPVERPVPRDCTQHAAHVRDDLPSSTYAIRISSQVRDTGRV